MCDWCDPTEPKEYYEYDKFCSTECKKKFKEYKFPEMQKRVEDIDFE